MIKTYEELARLETFEERYNYLKLGGEVGRATFGFERYLNSALYRSREWKRVRNEVLLRDDGCDLGIEDRRIFIGPIVHHLNPLSIEAIEEGDKSIFDLNNLITTTHNTHNAIHYGSEGMLSRLPKERTRGDTVPWR